MVSDTLSQSTLRQIDQAIDNYRLPEAFINTVTEFHWPLARWMDLRIVNNKPHVFGIQGAQGSGKSTCAHFLRLLLVEELKLRVGVVSLDDFYLSKAERSELAKQIHPLLETRGVPGTHDVGLIQTLFDAVKGGESVVVPVFDKATDDRAPMDEWQTIDSKVDLLIFEGWCVGLPPQTEAQLAQAVNALEDDEDPAGIWRNFVNEQLQNDYANIYTQLDTLIALQAPSFDCVFDWRVLQEQKLIYRLEQEGKDSSGTLTEEQIRRFISHYQRLTNHALATMPTEADALLILNVDHSQKRMVLS